MLANLIYEVAAVIVYYQIVKCKVLVFIFNHNFLFYCDGCYLHMLECFIQNINETNFWI